MIIVGFFLLSCSFEKDVLSANSSFIGGMVGKRLYGGDAESTCPKQAIPVIINASKPMILVLYNAVFFIHQRKAFYPHQQQEGGILLTSRPGILTLKSKENLLIYEKVVIFTKSS